LWFCGPEFGRVQLPSGKLTSKSPAGKSLSHKLSEKTIVLVVIYFINNSGLDSSFHGWLDLQDKVFPAMIDEDRQS